MRAGIGSSGAAGGGRQRGAVLLFAVVALGVMLVAGVAWVRVFSTSLLTKGSVAVKRDLENQSERAVDHVLTAFRATGPLSSPIARGSHLPASNYSATMLPSDARGLPNALALSDSGFASIYGAADLQSADKSVRIRYVVDRLCATTGDETALGAANCVVAREPVQPGTSAADPTATELAGACPTCAASATADVVYRVSIRVVGPLRAQSLFQSTFAVPSPARAEPGVAPGLPNAAAEPATAHSSGPRRLNWRELQTGD